MRIRFSKQEQEVPPTRKSTTRKCEQGVRNACSPGFHCKDKRCVKDDPQKSNQNSYLSDVKLVERLNKKLAMMVNNGQISYQKANGLKRMRFFRPAVTSFLQNKLSVDQYKDVMQNEQKRRNQQLRKRMQQQQQQQYQAY